MRERLNGADHRLLAVCCVVLALTLWFSARYFYRAFPEASIDFRVTRAQAGDLARQFLQAQGFKLDGYRTASRFQYDGNAKTFLERELGLERANQLMGSRVRLWRWSMRWFRPQQKEEFRAAISPRGEPLGFSHEIPETAPLPSLSQEQARTLAEQFLAKMGRQPGSLEFVEGSSTQRPARTDHVFTWKERDFNVHDATYRLEVTVLGNQAGGYREYLKVPETWQRGYERLRSRNEAAQTVDTALMFLLVVGLLIALAVSVRSGEIRWGRAAVVGTAGAGLSFLASWNSFPQAEFAYPTTDSFASFLTRLTVQYLLSALALGGLLFVLTAGAEPVYRRAFAGRISLGNLFSPRGLRTKSFFTGSVLGLTLAGVFVAYQTAFYLVAYHFGAWSPAEVPYDDLLNTRFPWLFVLFGGFMPAVSEEFMFRMFAIPFLRKLTRSVIAGLLLAGFIWGFGHAGYPQQPFYIRGVEVGIGGVVLGLVMLRWGILPTLVWHYSVDAMYTALLLLRSHNAYFAISGAASAGIMVLPVALAFGAYLRRGGFETEKGLTNGDEIAAAQPEAVPAEAPPAMEPIAADRHWSRRRRTAALAIVAAAAVFLLLPAQRFGEHPKFALSPGQAHSRADDFLRAQGIDPRAYHTVIFTETGFAAGKYLLEHKPLAWVAQAFQRDVPLYRWVVRYYKPLDAEEVRVSLNPETGAVFQFEHTFPEDRAGADLSPDAARILAADFLARHGFDLEGFTLKETTSERKKERRDHTLVWEAKPGGLRNVEEARYRVRVAVDGDRVASLSSFWKLPESYLRERSRRNALSLALMILNVAWIAGAVIFALWLLVQATRKRELNWRAALRFGWPVAAVGVLGQIAQFPALFQTYNTAIPLETFRAMMVTGVAMAGVMLLLMAVCGCGLLLAVRPSAAAVFSRASRRAGGRDALLGAAAAAGLYLFLKHAGVVIVAHFPALALLSPSAPSDFNSSVPALSALAGALSRTLFLVAALALIAHVHERLRTRRVLEAALVLLVVAALAGGDVHTPGEFALQFGMQVLAAGAVIAAFRLLGGHDLAYLLGAWTISLGTRMLEFLGAPAPALYRQGWVLVAALALSLAWVVVPAKSGTGYVNTASGSET